MKSSVEAIASVILDKEDMAMYVSEQFGFELDDAEKNAVSVISSALDQRAREGVLKTILDNRTNTGWTTSGHTGVDVEIYAFGAGAEAFEGNLNNTDIAKRIFEFLGKAPE